LDVERSTLNVQRSPSSKTAPRRSAPAGSSPIHHSSFIIHPSSPSLAIHTAHATAAIARALDEIKTDILLVVGDRVEAFAGATAAHLSHRLVAHVHGGDRALGQIDDSLRHAITKLSHLHFPATRESANRILKLGEDPSRIHQVGSPGLDGITKLATPSRTLSKLYKTQPKKFALLLLHPSTPNESLEEQNATLLLNQALQYYNHIILIYPNNDPGHQGILRALNSSFILHPSSFTLLPDLPRPDFLGLMRDSSALLGNSSSGIIEAASFHTPVLDVGPRQLGRERSRNVLHADFTLPSLRRQLKAIKSLRGPFKNVYGSGGSSRKIAHFLAFSAGPGEAWQKLIAY
jgi:UDP-hydrolysing UDP-N-acetyl-D-glucosamine 2-epimerase